VQNSFTIFRKEVASFFNSLVGYIVLIVFIILTGLFFWVFDEHVLLTGKANMGLLFQYAPIFFILLIPAITMRSISEEVKTGTIEFLATKPITDFQLVIGKFAAAAFLVFVTILPSFIFYLSLEDLAMDPAELQTRAGNPELLNQSLVQIGYAGRLDNGPIIGAYIGLFLLGSIFAAIGILSSALSDNQVVAYVIGGFLCFVMYFGFSFSSELESLMKVNLAIERLGLLAHYENISLGVVDTRDIVYFLSVLAITLAGTKATLSLKRR
jgi:ABC-2 type transport system permease protein